MNIFRTGEDGAQSLDKKDALSVFRQRFYPLPEKIYMDGNSLGLLSKDAEEAVHRMLNQWKHLAEKGNWRITQLPNGFYQTEVNDPENDKNWHDVTRRETIEGAEAAINGSIDHFSKKLEATKGPKVVKTFK